MREDPASDRRHGSRLGISARSNPHGLENGTQEAPGYPDHRHIQGAHSDASLHAAQHRAATEGEKRDAATSSAAAPELKRAKQLGQTFEPLISSADAAKLLGNIHVKTLQRYARRGKIPGYQIAGHWYFRASDLDVWLQSQVNSKRQPADRVDFTQEMIQ